MNPNDAAAAALKYTSELDISELQSPTKTQRIDGNEMIDSEVRVTFFSNIKE
jgi:hypothetical protein